MSLDILLQREDGSSLLDDQPLADECLDRVGTLSGLKRGGPEFLGFDGDPNDLAQGWGVLYPEGREDLLHAIDELVRWRRERVREAAERNGIPAPPVLLQPIPADMDGARFLRDIYFVIDEPERPKYLVLLGDFDGIPVAFQQALRADTYVGRLCFPTLDGYAAYAAKVCKAEGKVVAERRGRLLFYSTRDEGQGDGALEAGHSGLIQPLVDELRRDANTPEAAPLLGPNDGGWDALRTLAAMPTPLVLCSLSHGLGDGRWSADQQHELQGRMKLGPRLELDPDDVAKRPFLPDGAWFYYACFGAGTPAVSAYEPWLRNLLAAGVWDTVPDVLRTLARDAKPFVARQPQLALANPDGPLVVVAHTDIAFTYTFDTQAGGAPLAPPRAPVSTKEVLTALRDGSRAGYAMTKLLSGLHAADRVLLASWQDGATRDSKLVQRLVSQAGELSSVAADDPIRPILERVRAVRDELGPRGVTLEAVRAPLERSLASLLDQMAEAPPPGARALVGHNWMAHHDFGAWILLGDPAARLPLADRSGAARWSEPAGTTPPATKARPSKAEMDARIAAVAEYGWMVETTGERSRGEVADAHGVPKADLKRWFDTFWAAGRAALEAEED